MTSAVSDVGGQCKLIVISTVHEPYLKTSSRVSNHVQIDMVRTPPALIHLKEKLHLLTLAYADIRVLAQIMEM